MRIAAAELMLWLCLAAVATVAASDCPEAICPVPENGTELRVLIPVPETATRVIREAKQIGRASCRERVFSSV